MMLVDKIENPFGRVYYYPSCCSTMNIIPSQSLEGALIITDYQYGGVGRFIDRKWISDDNQNILLTLHLLSFKSSVPVQFFAIKALQQLIEFETKLHTEIKWPNDLLVNHKKIAGVLCRYEKGLISIGVGLNVNQFIFTDSNASSLFVVLGVSHDREVLVNKFLKNLKDLVYTDLSCNDINPYLYNLGCFVSYLCGTEVIEGINMGMDQCGRLLINSVDGLTFISAGEAVIKITKY